MVTSVINTISSHSRMMINTTMMMMMMMVTWRWQWRWCWVTIFDMLMTDISCLNVSTIWSRLFVQQSVVRAPKPLEIQSRQNNRSSLKLYSKRYRYVAVTTDNTRNSAIANRFRSSSHSTKERNNHINVKWLARTDSLRTAISYYTLTTSSAVAERPRDALCHWRLF